MGTSMARMMRMASRVWSSSDLEGGGGAGGGIVASGFWVMATELRSTSAGAPYRSLNRAGVARHVGELGHQLVGARLVVGARGGGDDHAAGGDGHAHLGRVERGAHALRVRGHVERLDRRVHRRLEAHEVQRPRLHLQDRVARGRGGDVGGRRGGGGGEGVQWLRLRTSVVVPASACSAPAPRRTYRFCGSRSFENAVSMIAWHSGTCRQRCPASEKPRGELMPCEGGAGPREVGVGLKVARVVVQRGRRWRGRRRGWGKRRRRRRRVGRERRVGRRPGWRRRRLGRRARRRRRRRRWTGKRVARRARVVAVVGGTGFVHAGARGRERDRPRCSRSMRHAGRRSRLWRRRRSCTEHRFRQ